jgi:Photosynthesis system II assembly factor YCF48
MGHEDHERKFEQALERHLRRDAAGARKAADEHTHGRDETGAAPCPDAETLAAFHECILSAEEMNAAKEHIAECSRCQEVLAQLEATDEIPVQVEAANNAKMRERVLSTATNLRAPKDISRGRGFKALRWAAPAGAIAAGLLIWFVVRDTKVQTLSHIDNVKVAQDQPAERRLPESRPLPKSPVPEPATNANQLNLHRKEESKIKQRVDESEAFPAPKRPSSSVTANSSIAARSSPTATSRVTAKEKGTVASDTSPHANIRQLPLNGRNYSSLQTLESNPPEIPSSQAEVSVAAAAPPVSDDVHAQSAAPAKEGAGANQGVNTNQTVEVQQSEAIQLQSRQQVVVVDKLEQSPSLKKDSFENPKIILALKGTARWRLLPKGRVERSDDGIKWRPQKSGVKVELLAGSAPSEVVCWLVGRGGTILRTTDGGKHWRKVLSPIGGDVAAVQAVDALIATISDADKRARFVTRDGGTTWEAAKE